MRQTNQKYIWNGLSAVAKPARQFSHAMQIFLCL